MVELRCVGCGAVPPETQTPYTLIGGKAGWRLVRVKAADGSLLQEWRCADCWNTYKRQTATSAAPAPAARRR